MTAARQERKSRSLIVTIVGALALTASAAIGAATTEMVVVNRYTGLAIDGFDPVAYFVDGAPKLGRAELELRSGGVTWRFQNEGNRAAFAADPAVYAPRFGGYDPVAIGSDRSVPGHPLIWLVVGQRLYLFYSEKTRAAFLADPGRIIDTAERRWPQVARGIGH